MRAPYLENPCAALGRYRRSPPPEKKDKEYRGKYQTSYGINSPVFSLNPLGSTFK